MTYNWGEVKAEIEKLYMKGGKSLEEVRDILDETRKFNPSLRAYKNKLEEWGFIKYNPRRKRPETSPLDLAQNLDFAQTTEAASALLVGSDSVTVKCDLKQVDYGLERQASEIRQQRIILAKVSRKRRREDPESDTEGAKNSLQRIAELETSVTRMRKTLEKVMTSVSVQTSAPTGFASCWKQEPMTLEDAHGKLLPLPLELVVSWEARYPSEQSCPVVDISQMFDSVLLSHFRARAGKKKVEKREFEIEDSVSRGTMPRTMSWSQFSEPGRKFEMSMIFKDAGRTSVVCPKCDTISQEKKGVQVECSNPDCKMIFRMEDDENADEDSSIKRRRLSGLARVVTTPSSSRDRDSAFDKEPEDLPGMFKRVIIRLLRNKTNFTQYGPQPTAFTYPATYGYSQNPLVPFDGSIVPEILDTVYTCSCGDGCQCIGCAAHPYNDASPEFVLPAWASINLEPRELYNITQTSVNGNISSQLLPVNTVSSPTAHTLSSTTYKNGKEQSLSATDFFFVNDPFTSDGCGGDTQACLCPDECECPGCAIHKQPTIGNEGNSSSVGNQGNVQNLVNTWFQKDPVDLPWDPKVFFGSEDDHDFIPPTYAYTHPEETWMRWGSKPHSKESGYTADTSRAWSSSNTM